jgi:hypothetical protein
MVKKITVFILLLISAFVNAQAVSEPAMADALREDGKIYVVISVIGIIFIAIVVFLIVLERKIKGLEEKFNKK